MVLISVSRENSLTRQRRATQGRDPSTAVDRRAWARRSILAQDDIVSEIASVPADRLFIQIDVDLFGFEIFFDAPGASFAAKAGLLVAAPRGFYVGWWHVIHPDNACAQGFYGAHGFEDVACPDRGG